MLEKIDKIQELLNIPSVDLDPKTAIANMKILNLLVDLRAEAKQLILSGVMPRISHFVSEIGQEYPANDEAVLIEIQDGNLRFYEIGYDFERIYLTPIYVA